MAISGLNKQEAITLLQKQGLSIAQQAQVLSSAGLLQTTQMLNASLVEEAVLNSKISGEKAEQVLTELGLIEAKTGNLIATNECTVAEVAQALATKGIIGADAEAILSQLGLATANTTATISFDGLTTAIKTNTIAMAKWLVTNPVGWCILAVGAIYGLTKAYDALTVSEEEMAKTHEESVQKAKDSVSEYEELKQELETIQQTYDDNEQKLKDLYKLRENQTITQAEQDYLEELEGQNEKLKQQIEYKQTLADIEAKEAEDEAVKVLNEKTQDDLLTGRSTNGGATVEFDKITDAEKIKQNTGTINALTADLTAYEKAIKGIDLSKEEVDKFSGSLENLYNLEKEQGGLREDLQSTKELYEALLNGTLTYEEYEKAVTDTTTKVQGLVSENDSLLQTVEPLNDAIKSTTGKNYELKKANDEIIANAKDAAIGFNNYTDSLNNTSNALSEVQKSSDETTALFDDIFSLKDADDALTNLGKISETIDTIQNAYKTLDDAIDEYNENGSFSIDTLQSVIGLGDDWLKYLVDEEGNLSLNKEALQELTRSRLEDMRIQTINNLIDNVGKIENETQALRYLTEANYDLGDSYEYVATQSLQLKLRELENKGVSSDTISKIAKQSMSDMQKINDFFNNVDLNTDGSLGGSSGSSSSSSSNEDTYEELVDFFERRIEALDDANSLLEKNLENVTGSFAKNNLIDSQLGIAEEKYKNYTDAISMYSQKASEALSKLPADIAEKVKNGSVSMTDFIGGGNEAVVDAINDYQDWADKISDCKEELAALKETIRDLELNKFNNTIEDYTNQFDLYENANDLLSKQISLLEEAGELIGESFYSAQIEESQKQLSLLEEEKSILVNQLNSSLASGRIQVGTDEWLEMVNALSDVDGSILECKTSIEELDNTLLDLHTQVFERIQEQFANLNSELENLFNLFDEDADVTDGKRNWTDEAIAQLGLLTQQYELSQYQIQQYDKEIERLNEDYLGGKYSATEYADKLANLSSAQWDAVNSSEAIKDSIVDLNKTRVDEIIEGIEEEIDAYKELADSKIEVLDAERDLKEYRDSIAEKSKSIADLEKQITAMQYDDTAATVAKRLQLEEQLAEAKKELEDAEYDHSIESQKDAINKQYEDYESIRNEEIEALEESLKDRETLIYNSFETVKANSNIIGSQIATIATQHGVKVSDSLISSWKSGENAIASYGTVLSQNSSAFIGNIIGIENEVLELQNKANSTANTLSYMFSTQADTLVSELKTSYNSEENLCNMTYALQDSLISTLERGYNINNIVNALDTIADKAKETWDSINGYDDGSQAGTQWRIVDKYGTYLSKPFDTQDEALSWADTYAKTTGVDVTLKKVKKYANGTRNAKNGLRIVNEEGYELTLPKVSSGNYTIGNAGDQILTKVETDNIFDWAKINPNMFNFKPIIPDTSSFIKKSDISPVSINYDSLIRVDGDVNNSNIKQIEAAVEAGIKKLSDNVNRNYRYGKR